MNKVINIFEYKKKKVIINEDPVKQFENVLRLLEDELLLDAFQCFEGNIVKISKTLHRPIYEVTRDLKRLRK